MMKPTTRLGLPNTDSGNQKRRFGKSSSRSGIRASLFDFNRNASSSSSENAVRHQPKSLFGFAEIRKHLNARRLGCDFLKGFYLAKPQTLTGKKMPMAFAPAFHVLRLLTEEASDAKVEAALKGAASLVVQSLRLANSSGRHHSDGTRITSIRQALSSVRSRQLIPPACDNFGLEPANKFLQQRTCRNESDSIYSNAGAAVVVICDHPVPVQPFRQRFYCRKCRQLPENTSVYLSRHTRCR